MNTFLENAKNNFQETEEKIKFDLEKSNDKNIEVNQTINQKNFLETTLGKTINVALDMGLRIILPDFIENQIIEIKDVLLNQGFKEGIKNSIDVAIDFGKSAIGIVTGEFENISQVQAAIGKGGIIDTISNTMDFVLEKTINSGMINKTVGGMIKKGKNVILDNISKEIENTLTAQIKGAEKLGKYIENWKQYYSNKDFDNMEKEYKKINTEIKKLIPIEKTLKEARQIENLHNLIKNKGMNFDISRNELELTKLLV